MCLNIWEIMIQSVFRQGGRTSSVEYKPSSCAMKRSEEWKFIVGLFRRRGEIAVCQT